jgi:hypothetical protein
LERALRVRLEKPQNRWIKLTLPIAHAVRRDVLDGLGCLLGGERGPQEGVYALQFVTWVGDKSFVLDGHHTRRRQLSQTRFCFRHAPGPLRSADFMQ